MLEERWKDQPEDHDYPAAQTYLSLLVDPETAKELVRRLTQREGVDWYVAKDILRASGLPHLPPDDPEVVRDRQKVEAGQKLSPPLLVRGSPLWVADGYHRICVSYHIDPKTPVPT